MGKWVRSCRIRFFSSNSVTHFKKSINNLQLRREVFEFELEFSL